MFHNVKAEGVFKCNSNNNRRPAAKMKPGVSRVNHAGDCPVEGGEDAFYPCKSCSTEDLSNSELDRRLSNWFDCWDVFDYFSQVHINKYVARVEQEIGRAPNDSEMRYIRKVTTADWEARSVEDRRRYLDELTRETARTETERERVRIALAAARTNAWLEKHFPLGMPVVGSLQTTPSSHRSGRCSQHFSFSR